MKRLIFAIAMSLMGSASALCLSGLEVGAEVIYMQPSACDFAYAVADPRAYVAPAAGVPQENTEEFGPHGAIKAVAPTYEFGFRVKAGFARCDRDVRAIYTWLHTRHSVNLRPDPIDGGIWANEFIASNPARPTPPTFFQSVLFNASGDPTLPFEIGAIVKASQECNYDAADLQAAMSAQFKERVSARFFAGLHFANIDTVRDLFYQGTSHPGVTAAANADFQSTAIRGSVRRSARVWGVGPRFGVDGHYDLCCGFGIVGRGAIAILVGQGQAKYSQRYTALLAETDVQTEDRSYSLTTGNRTLVAPALDARAGVSHTTAYGSCCAFTIQVGWEWISYIRMVPTGPIFRMDKGASRLRCATFSLGGPYLAALYTF